MKSFLIILSTLIIMNLNALNLRLKQSVNIKDNNVYLKDIIESFDSEEKFNSVKDMQVYQFNNNKNVNLTAISIKTKLLQNFGMVATVEGGISAIHLKENRLEANVIIDEVKKFLKNEKNVSDRVEINIVRLEKIILPSSKVDFQFAIARETKSSAAMTLEVKILENNIIWKKFPLSIEVYDYQKIAIASSTIRRDNILSEQNVNFIEKKISINDPIVKDPKVLEKVVAQRLIPKGKTIKYHHLKTPDAVKRNNLVTVLVQSGSIELSFQGLAKESGQIGENIQVENPNSKERFSATIIDRNKTLIALGGK